MFLRRLLLLTALALTACSSNPSEPSDDVSLAPPPSWASALPSGGASSSAPIPSATGYQGITQGLIVANCEVRDGTQYVEVTQFDPATGGVASSTVFEWLPGDRSMQSAADCDSKNKRTAFNEDFTRLFVSREDVTTDSVGIGYLSPGPGGGFTMLSEKPDEFTSIKDQFPSYKIGDGRVYYCNNAEQASKLMSMTIDGQDVKTEDELLKSVSGGECTDLLMAETKRPIVRVPDVLYDRDGSTTVMVTGKAASPSFTVNKGGYEKVYTLSPANFNHRELTLVGFLDEFGVVFTDAQKIYVATLNGKTAEVKAVLNNTVADNKIVDARVSEDGAWIAFITEKDSVRRLYTLFVETDEVTEITSADVSKGASVVQFN